MKKPIASFCYPEPVPTPPLRLQPSAYHAFRCLGADCEDTCCAGWIVNVDKATYQTYQGSSDADLGPRLRELITINPAPSDDSYARIALAGLACPFLDQGLCEIQNKLGEASLSLMCSTYPRVLNAVDDVLQRSLALSCPEAARVILLDPGLMRFDEEEGPAHDPRIGHLSVLRTADGNAGKPYLFFREIRAFIVWLLQHRVDPLWKRLAILASFCDELHKMAEAGQVSPIPDVLEGCRDAVERDLFGPGLEQIRTRPAAQLEMVLDLIVARITADFTPPRFLACYQEFMQGIEWTAQSAMNELGERYSAAFSQHYAPFLGGHQHILENYLVNYVHSTLFPLGPQETGRQLSADQAASSIREQCQMMLIHFAIIQALLIGLAGLHKSGLNAAHAIRVIQSYTKAFEHSLSFPARARQIVAAAGVHDCVSLALLIRN